MSKKYTKSLEKIGFPIMIKILEKEYGPGNILLIDRRELDDDYKNCTDAIIIKNGNKFKLAARFRNPDARHTRSLTIRAKTKKGGYTELDKLKDGVGADIYFYAIFRDFNYKEFSDYYIIDLVAMRYKEVWGLGKIHDNPDGSGYISIPIRDLLKKGCILTVGFYKTLDNFFAK